MKKILALATAVALSVPVCTTDVQAAGDRCPQWRPYALFVGWTPQQWRTLDRIMWRESKCDPKAFNGDGADHSLGLVQVNTKGYLWSGHQGVRDVCGRFVHRREDLFRPLQNLWCARELYLRYGGEVLWRVGF